MTSGFRTLKVVEVCDGAPVAYCARQFALHGAEVVALEPPGGSPLRSRSPFIGSDAQSAVWAYLSAGKRFADLDAGTPALIEGADVFLTDWSPARLASIGIDVDALRTGAPRLVTLLFSDFGRDGPYADHHATDLVLQALTGSMSVNGEPGLAPLKTPANALSYAAGASAFVGVLAALHARNSNGSGQVVEVRALEALASLVQYTWTEYFGRPARRAGGVGPPMLPCSDGYLFFEYSYERTRSPLLKVLGMGEDDLPDEVADIGRVLAEHTSQRSSEELFRGLCDLGAVAAIVKSPVDLLSDPHLAARGFFDRENGRVFPGPPMRISTSATIGATEPVRADGSGSAPLSDVRILDFTQAWLGPYATLLLADLGADVIKIESRGRPDVWRVLAEVPPCARPGSHKWNTSHWFNSVGRNKRSLTIDLNDERGRALVLRLVEDADLVCENYTPRVMRAFGLDYESLRERNPRVVMVSFSGYGSTGPYSAYKANGASIETIAGWASLHGYPGHTPMTTGGYPVDPITGLHMAAAALIGLLEARATGSGQAIEGSMIESALSYIGDEVLAAPDGTDSPPKGNRDRDMCPHEVFPCAGEDEWIAIAVRDDADWLALVDLTGDAALDDHAYASAAGRRANEDTIEEAIARWTRQHSARDAMTKLQAAGVPAGVVNTTESVFADDHLRDWFVPMHHVDVGTHRYYGFPWRFSESELDVRLPPPRVGEHIEEILGERLGLSPEEIAALMEAGVTRSALEFVPRDRST